MTLNWEWIKDLARDIFLGLLFVVFLIGVYVFAWSIGWLN